MLKEARSRGSDQNKQKQVVSCSKLQCCLIIFVATLRSLERACGQWGGFMLRSSMGGGVLCDGPLLSYTCTHSTPMNPNKPNSATAVFYCSFIAATQATPNGRPSYRSGLPRASHNLPMPHQRQRQLQFTCSGCTPAHRVAHGRMRGSTVFGL